MPLSTNCDGCKKAHDLCAMSLWAHPRVPRRRVPTKLLSSLKFPVQVSTHTNSYGISPSILRASRLYTSPDSHHLLFILQRCAFQAKYVFQPRAITFTNVTLHPKNKNETNKELGVKFSQNREISLISSTFITIYHLALEKVAKAFA